ncbi:MAG TPA: DUF6159 family protein [Acidimicrobiales bacterium]|nr:DUF6159 family protein [Acidimicrobiales bacterium]
MGRISHSFAMAGASWRVLQSDRELFAIPVMSMVSTAATALLGGGAIYFSLNRDVVRPDGTTGMAATPFTYVVGVVAYLLITFVLTFFAAALVAGARERLMGGRPTLGSAFTSASTRLPEIVLWSLLTGTVGLALNLVRNRAGVVGQIAARLVGTTWEVVTWLAVPVIVAEGTGPIESLRRSAGLFRVTWGENLTGQIGFGVFGLVAGIPGVVISGLLMVTMPAIGIVVGVIWVVVTSVVISAMSGVFRTVLYQFASGAPIPEEFTHVDLADAFRPRSRHQLTSLAV